MTSTISALGDSVIMGNEQDEILITAKADGVAKAGDIVHITTGTAAIANSDVDAVDLMIGILKERYDTDIDTVPTASDPVDVIIPRSGHLYRVITANLSASGPGIQMILTNAAGLGKATAIETNERCRTFGDSYVTGDTVAEVIWS